MYVTFANKTFRLFVYEDRKKATEIDAILVTNPLQAQIKKQTKATVIYEPDFSHKDVEKHARQILTQGWCDALLHLERSPKHDKPHKKQVLITQVDCKLMKKHAMTILIDKKSIQESVFVRQSRIHHIVTLAKKFKLSIHVVLVGEALPQSANAHIDDILDVL